MDHIKFSSKAEMEAFKEGALVADGGSGEHMQVQGCDDKPAGTWTVHVADLLDGRKVPFKLKDVVVGPQWKMEVEQEDTFEFSSEKAARAFSAAIFYGHPTREMCAVTNITHVTCTSVRTKHVSTDTWIVQVDTLGNRNPFKKSVDCKDLWSVVDAKTGKVKPGAPFDGMTYEEAVAEAMCTYGWKRLPASVKVVPLTPKLARQYIR